LMLTLGLAAHAQNSVREQEIAQCLPGEIVTWGDGKDRPAISSPLVFVYDHANAPAWFDQGLVLAAIQKAATHWSTCGVPSQVVVQKPGGAAGAASVAVIWGDEQSRGNFGLANWGLRTLALGPAAFALLQTRNPAHDARETLQMVISHEMGHVFGLMAHSRRCVDVTSYYHNGKGEKCVAKDQNLFRSGIEYRATLPTACDLQRCRAANGY
jgi:hypothetical protein